jgi:hypothetical protein
VFAPLCTENKSFNSKYFFIYYFLLLIIATSLQFAIAQMHYERKTEKKEPANVSWFFIISKIPQIFYISILRFFLDWLVVISVIIGAGALSQIFNSRRIKNIIGKIVAKLIGFVLLILSNTLFVFCDKYIGRFIRFGIPILVYNPKLNLAEYFIKSKKISEAYQNSQIQIDIRKSSWSLVIPLAVLFVALPIADTFNGGNTSLVLFIAIGSFIIFTYLIIICFTLIYCDVLEKLQSKKLI